VGMSLLALSAVFPLYFMISGAFRTDKDWASSEIGLPTTTSLHAFRTAWQAASIGIYVRNSVVVTTGTVALTLVIAIAGGYAFSHLSWRGRNGAYLFVLAWLAVPPVALLVPIYEEMNRLSLVDTYWSVILLYTALSTPFNIYLLTSYMRGLSGEFVEAARMDGAGPHAILREVIIPLSKPAIATLSVFNFLFAWNEFVFALLLLQSDNVRTATPGVLQLQGKYVVDYPVLVGGLLIVSLPVVGVYLFFQRYLVQAIVAGGIK
jgi:ABC-type glycerol-3-phosphate transport system permease component